MEHTGDSASPRSRASRSGRNAAVVFALLAIVMFAGDGCKGTPVQTDAERVLDLLPPAERAKLHPSPVPVLLPELPSLQLAEVSVGPRFYEVFLPDGPRELSVAGRMPAPDTGPVFEAKPPDLQVRGRPAYVIRSEILLSVTWEEDGSIYNIDLTCGPLNEDPHCTSPDFLRDLAETLVRVQ